MIAGGTDIFHTAEVVADGRVKKGLAAQLEMRDNELQQTDSLGWKIGLNAPAAMERLGTAGPVLGYLTKDRLLDPGSQVSVGKMTHAGLEPELAIVVGDDLQVVSIAPAVELVDVDMPIDDVEAILAANVFHKHVLLGEVTSDWSALERLNVSVTKNGEQLAVAESVPTIDDLRATLRHVAGLLGSHDISLRPGDVVIAGSLTAILPVAAEDDLRADFGELGALELSFVG